LQKELQDVKLQQTGQLAESDASNRKKDDEIEHLCNNTLQFAEMLHTMQLRDREFDASRREQGMVEKANDELRGRLASHETEHAKQKEVLTELQSKVEQLESEKKSAFDRAVQAGQVVESLRKLVTSLEAGRDQHQQTLAILSQDWEAQAKETWHEASKKHAGSKFFDKGLFDSVMLNVYKFQAMHPDFSFDFTPQMHHKDNYILLVKGRTSEHTVNLERARHHIVANVGGGTMEIHEYLDRIRKQSQLHSPSSMRITSLESMRQISPSSMNAFMPPSMDIMDLRSTACCADVDLQPNASVSYGMHISSKPVLTGAGRAILSLDNEPTTTSKNKVVPSKLTTNITSF